MLALEYLFKPAHTQHSVEGDYEKIHNLLTIRETAGSFGLRKSLLISSSQSLVLAKYVQL